jgi:hypothetical protein
MGDHVEGAQTRLLLAPPAEVYPGDRARADRGDLNEGFANVPCAIWRSDDDGGEMFEEAELNVSINSDYEGDRLVEISVLQPDDYQGESGGSSTEAIAVYLSAGNARAFANGLLKAVERAEAEGVRKRTKGARRVTRSEKTNRPRSHGG